jgi:serine/threonine-protein kinase
VYDAGEQRHASTGLLVPFLIMEFVEGCSLQQIIRREAHLPEIRALQTAATVLDALACSHAAGIVHRDVKPANVLITSSGQAKLGDFGIARSMIDSAATATETGLIMGTPQYMSPEQVRGASADARSDLYAVGCMLYESLTGRPPFLGDSAFSIGYQHVAELPTPTRDLDPRLRRQTDEIVLRALAKDPVDRYPSASAMRADIETMLSCDPPDSTVRVAEARHGHMAAEGLLAASSSRQPGLAATAVRRSS